MLWKIYFWFIVILISMSFFDTFMLGMSYVDFFDLAFTIISCIGFFGFIYKKTFFSKAFWKKWLFIIIIWDIIYNTLLQDYSELISEFSDLSTIEILVSMAIGIMIIIPYYVAIYLYGYKSFELWNEKDESKIGIE